MSTTFPTTKQSWSAVDPNTSLSANSHDDLHDDVNDTVEALQDKIGLDSSATTTTHDYKLSGVTGSDVAASLAGTEAFTNKTITNPTVTTGTFATPALTTPTITTPTMLDWDGWVTANETWTYASTDDPTFTFTINGDKTSKYSLGMKLKLTQTSAKYFLITKIAYSDPSTTVTVYGGTTYDLANAAISNPFYSSMKAPQGFPLDPDAWTVETKDSTGASQPSPTQNQWYNLGSITISAPIGLWMAEYQMAPFVQGVADVTASMEVTLSTANSTESEAEFTSVSRITNDEIQAGNDNIITTSTRIERVLTRTSKSTYYLNARTVNASLDSLQFRGDLQSTFIRLRSVYL